MHDFQVSFRFSGDNVFTLQYNLIGLQVEKQRRVANIHVSMQERHAGSKMIATSNMNVFAIAIFRKF
jgi:hypothetical protein